MKRQPRHSTIVIRRVDFDRYLSTHPNETAKLTMLIGLRLRKIKSRVEDEDLVFRDVPARLAHLLLELRESDGVWDGAGTHLCVKLPPSGNDESDWILKLDTLARMVS